MAARIPYETLAELAEQLPREQREDLIRRLQQRAQPDTASASEKMKRLREAQISVAVNVEPSLRREDWYADNGR